MAKRSKKIADTSLATIDQGAMLALIEQAEAHTDETFEGQDESFDPLTGEVDVGDVVMPRRMTDLELDALVEEIANESPVVSADPMLSEESAIVAEVVADLEAVQELPATELVLDPPATETDVVEWSKALAAIPDDLVDIAVHSVARAFDDRAAYEADKNPDNTNIQRTLKKARAQLATKRATRAMLVCGFDEGQINRVKHEGARYNVYALGKLADILYAVTDGAVSNAINNAVMRSLFKFRKAGQTFTMEMAKAAASDKIRVDNALRGILVRHTVSSSTAPTQASSTMQALVDLGVVSRSGSEKNPVFALTESPIVAELDAILQAA